MHLLCKVRPDQTMGHYWHFAGVSSTHPKYHPDVSVKHDVCCWCGATHEEEHGKHIPLMPPNPLR